MGESSAKQQDEARARATLRRFIDIETKPTDGKRSFDELLGEMVKSLAAAFAEVRRAAIEACARVADERAAQHRETVELWRQSGDMRSESLAVAILDEAKRVAERIRSLAPEPPDQPGAERMGGT